MLLKQTAMLKMWLKGIRWGPSCKEEGIECRPGGTVALTKALRVSASKAEIWAMGNSAHSGQWEILWLATHYFCLSTLCTTFAVRPKILVFLLTLCAYACMLKGVGAAAALHDPDVHNALLGLHDALLQCIVWVKYCTA